MQTHTYMTYRKIKRTLSHTLLLVTTVFAIQPAYAAIVASTTLLNKNIAVNQPSSVTIPWKVVTTGAATVSSTQAAFMTPGGTVLQRVNTQMSGSSFIHAGEAFPSFQTTEALLIPASVVAKARAAGATQLRYSRVFSDGQPGTISFLINITGSAGARFSISREALSFTDK